MLWDHEVDVVCSGLGVGGLAGAITAVDAGLETFVARSRVGVGVSRSPQPVQPVHPWFGASVADPDTTDYFSALSANLGPSVGERDADLPIRVVDVAGPADARGGVEPFFGARLRDWAARCLASPYGFVHTRVADDRVTTMRTRGGETVEVAMVGALDTDSGFLAGSTLTDWLDAQARDRCIEMSDDYALTRIVFEEGEVMGAVFDTPDGPFAVRARHGVTIAGGAEQPPTTVPAALAGCGAVQVGLVRQTASRFGRLELLTTEPAAGTHRPACTTGNRHLHDTLHDGRQLLSIRRCRKVHRYPPFGQ